MSPRRVTVSVACAVGFLTGLRALIAVDLPDLATLVAVEPVPKETLGVSWTEVALWPLEARQAAITGLVRTLATLLFAAGGAAALNGAVALAEGAGSRRQELAVRYALGASPWTLATALLGELRNLMVAGIAFGLVGGAAGGLVLRALWPHALTSWFTGTIGPIPMDLAILVGMVLAVSCLAHLSGLRSVVRPGRTADLLRAGARSTADPAAIFLRRTLAAAHVAVSGSILICAIALAAAVSEARVPSGLEPSDFSVATLSGGDVDVWGDVLAAVADVPGIEAESLAAPGTLLGLGIHDIATTECGNCWRGLFPAPLWNTLADHHAVSSGYFELNGLTVAEGRDFRAGDEAGEPVVIVNRRLAETSFENGRALGKRLKLGSGVGNWFRVIGVVEDEPIVGLGAAVHHSPAIYLNVLQRAPLTAQLLLRGPDAAIVGAIERVEALGLSVTTPLPIAAWRAEQNAPLGWARGVAWVVAFLSLLVTIGGVRAVARQIARRRIRDLAIRRALGASDGALARTLMAERLRTSFWGIAGFLFSGTMAAAFVEQGAGAAPPPLAAWVAVSLMLVIASAGASVESLRIVRDTDSAELMA